MAKVCSSHNLSVLEEILNEKLVVVRSKLFLDWRGTP